jgi:DNA-binding transcriptional MocR family regulator
MAQRSSNISKAREQEIINGKLTTVERFPSREKLCDRFVASRAVNFRTYSLYRSKKWWNFTDSKTKSVY